MVTGTNKQEFLDNSFKLSETLDYHLSIETGDDFLYCAVHDARSGKLLAVDAEKPGYMDNHFKSVSCVVYNSFFTLVPNDIFDINDALKYLQLNCTIEKNMTVMHDFIPGLNAYSVYAIDDELKQRLERKFPSVMMKHSTSVILEELISKAPANENSVFVVVHKGIFELIICKDGKLVFTNVFHYKIHEDIAYYIHFAMEQLEIRPDDVKIYLTGPSITESLQHFLHKFFNVYFLEKNEKADALQNRFFTLIRQQSCVS